ncbi:MAG: sugar transferase [Saprospiraceae bacterium]|nr:sugar transferase [Saprospiraceae bacterium]
MYSIIKRFFDIIFSLLALVVLSPLLIPIAIGLKFTGEGYIFYLQERVGYKNKLFNIYKFATMLKDSPNMTGGLITLKRDPRLTPMGGFLRDSKINELPQLLNILFGDMSFVGPRPVMQKSFDVYPENVKEIIYNVKPGLTGIGSVIFRDEETLITKVKNEGGDTWDYYKNKIYPFKGELEIWYQKNPSFLTDIKLIVITGLVIIFPKNNLIYHWFPSLPKRNF